MRTFRKVELTEHPKGVADPKDRSATVNVYATEGTPFTAAVTDEKGTKLIDVETSRLFVDTAAVPAAVTANPGGGRGMM